MPLVQVVYLQIQFPADFKSQAIPYAGTFAASAAPGSVKQIMADVAAQSRDHWTYDMRWVCRTETFIRQDFLPGAVPYLRGLYTAAGLLRGQYVLIASVLDELRKWLPPTVLET